MSAKLAFKVFALSDLGLVREGNEDSGLVSSNLDLLHLVMGSQMKHVGRQSQPEYHR